MCDCMARVNENLKSRNTKLATSFMLSKDLSSMDCMLNIQTVKVDPKIRGKALAVIPTFCPFCGVKYPRADDGQEQAA